MKEILPNIHQLKLGAVNAYLIEDQEELILIDTGYPGNEDKILGYIQKIGKTPEQLQHIILTHLHADHSGSAAALSDRTTAKSYIHPDDAEMLKTGRALREPIRVSPGLVSKLVYYLFIKWATRTVPPVDTDEKIDEQENFPVGKGFQVIHLPGHCKGQIALLYKDHGGVLFAADSCANLLGLGFTPVYEDLEQGKKDLARLCELEFGAITFGHGDPILKNASKKFREKFDKYRK